MTSARYVCPTTAQTWRDDAPPRFLPEHLPPKEGAMQRSQRILVMFCVIVIIAIMGFYLYMGAIMPPMDELYGDEASPFRQQNGEP
jgi:hypothetical protein